MIHCPLDLHVVKEHLLARVLKFNCDTHFGPVHFSADEIQRKVGRWRVHLAMSLTIDWEEATQNIEDTTAYQKILIFTYGSKIADDFRSGGGSNF